MKSKKLSYNKILVLFSIVVVLVLMTGCVNPPIVLNFSANPSTISLGDSSTLNWEVSNADTVKITPGVGTVASIGSTIVSPAVTTTYILTATNSDGTVTASVTVTVGAAAYGSIDVNSTPSGANVYLDGVDKLSVTPVTLSNVAVGNRTIKLTKLHYKNKEEVVTVIANQTTSVNLPLDYAPQETITIQPGATDGKDAYVYENSPTIIYGTSGSLVIGTISGPSSYRSYLQFDLSSVPPTAVILYARLGLYYGWSWPNTSFYISLYEVEESWGEDTITWNNQPASSSVEEGKTYIPASATNNFRWWYINDLVKGWYDGSISNYGMVLEDTDESSDESAKTFYSSDLWDASMHPKLVIDYYLP